MAEGSGGGGEVAMRWVGTHFEPITAPSRAPEQEGMEGTLHLSIAEDLERGAREQEPEGEAPLSDIAGYRL